MSDFQSLKPSQVGGFAPIFRHSTCGEVLLESEDSMGRMKGEIKDVIATSSCRGECDKKMCSCVRKVRKCVGLKH